MKQILVPIEPYDGIERALASALLLARRHEGHIEGVHVRLAMPRMVPSPAGGGGTVTPRLVESLAEEDRERRQRARAAFESFMREHGVPLVGRDDRAPGLRASWHELVSAEETAIAQRSRVADVIVVGRPVRGQPLPSPALLESALFDSGRPVLIAPPSPVESLGERVLIAWNASPESARSVAFAMPVLARAGLVTVLTVDGGMVGGPSGRDLARHLALHGIEAEVVERAASADGIGEAILEEAARGGADLLVKGAYTHSRLRQMIFGGATSHILEVAELPVLMAH
jgi:nucleotide-binding universal stress UspA family protein